jgi:hypothetical protein
MGVVVPMSHQTASSPPTGSASPEGKEHRLAFGNSRMAQKILGMSWSHTPLGDVDTWPLSLVTTLRLVLNTTQPICFWWGPQLINFHNDGYDPMLGNRKDAAIGAFAPDLWPDVWEDILPLIEKALHGEATSLVDFPLVMTRNGYEEATNWTFSYSPIFDDDGHVVGMMNISQNRRRLFARAPSLPAPLRARGSTSGSSRNWKSSAPPCRRSWRIG